jgi:hypothetical protein
MSGSAAELGARHPMHEYALLHDRDLARRGEREAQSCSTRVR